MNKPIVISPWTDYIFLLNINNSSYYYNPHPLTKGIVRAYYGVYANYSQNTLYISEIENKKVIRKREFTSSQNKYTKILNEYYDEYKTALDFFKKYSVLL